MPVTTLDPKTALIVIDLQKGIAGYLPADVWRPVVDKSRALADAFRALGLPVVLVTADGVAPGRSDEPSRLRELPPSFADVVDEMDPQPSDIRVVKKTWGAFASTDLGDRLKTLGVTQVVITGVATTFGVESTARQAYEAGLNVTIPVDAVADPRSEAHDNSLTRVFPRLGETGQTRDVIDLLNQRSA